MNLKLIARINIPNCDFCIYVLKSNLGQYVIGTSCGIFQVESFHIALGIITKLLENPNQTITFNGRLMKSVLMWKGF